MDKTPVDMQYIIQLKNGFTVRITRFDIRKEFYDHHHDGREGALAAATAFRDQMYIDHGIRKPGAGKPMLKAVSRTETGVLPGVYINIDKGSAYFIARTHDGEGWRKKRFSIKKLGYQQAFWSAVDHRLAGSDLPVELTSDQITLHLPTMEEYLFLVTVCKDTPIPKAPSRVSEHSSPEP